MTGPVYIKKKKKACSPWNFLHLIRIWKINESADEQRPGRTVHKYSTQIYLLYFLVQGLGWGKSWTSQAEDWQACQLTELQQTREWERYPQRFQQLSETLQPENWGRHRWQWPASKRDSGIHLFLQETANHKISQSMLMAQSPKDSQWQQLASLLSMVQPPSRKTVQALVSTSS